MKKNLFGAFLCFIIPYSLLAQNQRVIIPPSPAAAIFDKYQAYPVDYYTGLPSIEVPLYTLNAKSITVPISLSYHASGFRPGELSYPVGMGWTLNPGARISRTVFGFSDDYVPFPTTIKTSQQIDPVNDLIYLSNLEKTPVAPQSSNRTTLYDSEYDIFSYNTGSENSESGKFIIKHTSGQPLSAEPLTMTSSKITVHLSTPTNGYFDYFEITDDKGQLFRFGKSIINNADYTESDGVSYGRSSWMLSEIISADKTDTVSFTWAFMTGGLAGSGNAYGMPVVQDTYSIDDLNAPTVNNAYYTINRTGTLNSSQPTSRNLIENLTSIKYKNKTILFNYTSAANNLLSNIQVLENNQKVKQIDLAYSSFPVSPPNPSVRTKLDAVKFSGVDYSATSTYGFKYNTAVALNNDFSTRGIDYWGYFNGASGNYTTVPAFSYPFQYDLSPATSNPVSSSIRDPNEQSMEEGILNEVDYPTGGKTTLSYEANRYQGSSTAQLAGGLRIAQMISYDSNNSPTNTRTYKYGIGESGLGDVHEVPQGNNYISSESMNYIFVPTYYAGTIPIYYYRTRVFTGNSKNNFNSYTLNPVTYQMVTEYYGDANSNIGKIVYEYPANTGGVTYRSFGFNASEVYAYASEYWLSQPEMTKKTIYKNNGTTYLPVQEIDNSYVPFRKDTLTGLHVFRYANLLGSGISYNTPQQLEAHFNIVLASTPRLQSVFTYGEYYITSGIQRLMNTTTTNFLDNGTTQVKTIDYTYANNQYVYPTAIKTSTSNGYEIQNFTYPLDYSINGTANTAEAQGIQNLQQTNVLKTAIEQYTQKVNSDGSNLRTIASSLTTYKPTIPYPAATYMVAASQPITGFTPTAITASAFTKDTRYEPRLTFNQYDINNNITEQQKVNAVKEVYLWGYNGLYPVAKVVGSDYNTVKGFVNQTILDNKSDQYTDADIRTELNKIRTGLVGTIAQVTTYTYSPLVGMTSSTDPKNQTTYYEYDSFQRLMNIKDKDGNILKHMDYHYQGQ